MSLTVSEEAILAERELASRLRNLHKDLLVGTKNLATAYQENQNGLGSHSGDIEALIGALVALADGGSSVAVKKLVRRLTLSANNRQQHRDNSLYRGRSR